MNETAPANRFNWRNFDAYLFDIDGTLLNSRDGVHYHSFHSGLQQAWNCEVRIDNVSVHGNTDIGILRAAAKMGNISEAEFQSGLSVALAEMCSQVDRNAANMKPEVCPDIPRLLSELDSAGKLLAVASGNLEPIGWNKLRAANIAQYFTFGSFSGDREFRVDIFRFGLERISELKGRDATACIIGDTPSDIQAAHALGLPVIAVATGIYSLQELQIHKPELCIPSCTALWA